jgi:hypothetical protein
LTLLAQVEIPNVDDHISKLEHMGKETVKKLQDIRGSATASGMEVAVPDNTINKGGWVGGWGCGAMGLGEGDAGRGEMESWGEPRVEGKVEGCPLCWCRFWCCFHCWCLLSMPAC